MLLLGVHQPLTCLAYVRVYKGLQSRRRTLLRADALCMRPVARRLRRRRASSWAC